MNFVHYEVMKVFYLSLDYLFSEPVWLNIRSYFLYTHHIVHVVE